MTGNNPDSWGESAGDFGDAWMIPIRAVDLGDNPYALAGWWSNRDLWGELGARDVRADLAELAVVTKLWTMAVGWVPVLIHEAYLSGASTPAVMAAMDTSFGVIFAIWEEWVLPLRKIWDEGDEQLGISADEAERVMAAMGLGSGDIADPDEFLKSQYPDDPDEDEDY